MVLCCLFEIRPQPCARMNHETGSLPFAFHAVQLDNLNFLISTGESVGHVMQSITRDVKGYLFLGMFLQLH